MELPTILNWAVALAPVVLLLMTFEWLDVFHLIHIREVIGLMLLGAVAGLLSYPLGGALLDALPLGFSNYSRFVAPWIEEALKAAVIIALFARNRIGFKLDAAISGFAIGAGFSVLENCIYLLRFDHLSFGVWLVRGLGTAVMHGGAAALMAALAHQLNEQQAQAAAARWRFRPLRFAPGYLVAVTVHVAFNQFPDQPLLAMLGALLLLPFAVVLVLRYGEAEARALLAAETVGHRAALDELRSGQFPTTASGRLVEALAARANGRASPALIQQFLAVQTELILRAEETMRGDADGAHVAPGAADRDLFDRLDLLRLQLGRTTLHALATMLPFTREEYWELHELRKRLPATR